jgi:hypothetical protein
MEDEIIEAAHAAEHAQDPFEPMSVLGNDLRASNDELDPPELLVARTEQINQTIY